ncbi:hypothetical protein BH11ARM2_BH11ARM2_23320 [soil metagenome]
MRKNGKSPFKGRLMTLINATARLCVSSNPTTGGTVL